MGSVHTGLKEIKKKIYALVSVIGRVRDVSIIMRIKLSFIYYYSSNSIKKKSRLGINKYERKEICFIIKNKNAITLLYCSFDATSSNDLFSFSPMET